MTHYSGYFILNLIGQYLNQCFQDRKRQLATVLVKMFVIPKHGMYISTLVIKDICQ